jgi:CheY-like chemotaxis protein
MKRALIVDDSRLARHVLSSLLTEHGVAADCAESAEAALEHLKAHRPDVIFLDHQMPGMDGFEALEAIKANPLTATIPVMMYTSKEGELYLGQARALGAIGVLPKDVEPVEVKKVLRSLRLIPVAGDAEAARAAPPAPQPLDARQLRELLAELFYEQNAAWRGELTQQLERLAARNAADTEPPLPAVVQPQVDPIGSWVYQLAIGVLAVVAVAFGYLYFRTNTLLLEAHERTQTLAAAATDLSLASQQALGAPAAAAPEATPAQAASPRVLEVLEAGFNRGGQFGFGEVGLDDRRADVLGVLLEELERIGFAGTVVLDVHVGRFCMNYAPSGDLELAPPEQSAATCDQIGWPELEAVAMGQEQTLDFAYTVANTTKQWPSVSVETRSHGSAVPLVPYPTSDYDLTTADWNAIAARNQRVELRLEADATADRP